MWAALFLAHPRRVGETYFEHQKVACSFSIRLLLAGVACLIHAVVPGLFERAASSTVFALRDEMERRIARQIVPCRDSGPGITE